MSKSFWKPGTQRPEASLSLDVDKAEGDGAVDILASSRFDSTLSLSQQRKRLPVFQHRAALLYLVETHGTTIVVGQTGSGKTTQIPQYLAEVGWCSDGRMIACTQPRRVAAQTVAARVAEEWGCELGREVGYCVRFDDRTSKGLTRIKYLTDGVLLREMMDNPLLSQYGVIMVDEAHERSLSTDVLLGLLKKVQRRRSDLRLIIASASMAAHPMAEYFNSGSKSSSARATSAPEPEGTRPSSNPAILSIEGRSHPVQLLYLEEPCSNYLTALVETVMSIHAEEPPGDILAFLTGQEEVERAVEMLEEEGRGGGLLPLSLFAGLPRQDQDRVFSPTPSGRRKVIVATNIAETSVTIEGIVYVVDCGFVKQKFFNPVSCVESLLVCPISKSSALQRAGRAGRVRPGKCYRLYTEDAFEGEMADTAIPEIQRADLSSSVMQLKSLGIDNIMRFDFLSSPSPPAMMSALQSLFALGALDEDGRLTKPIGQHMSEIPLDPPLSRMLIAAASEFDCAEEGATIAACMCVQSVWISSTGQLKLMDELKSRFAAAEGDYVTYLNVFRGFIQSGKSPRWCHANGVDHRALARVCDIRSQLLRLLNRLGLPTQPSGGKGGRDVQHIEMAVVSGLFMNAAQLMPYGDGSTYRSLRSDQTFKIHPSSCLFRATPPYVVYHALSVKGSAIFMRDVASIERVWLTQVAPHFYTSRTTKATM